MSQRIGSRWQSSFYVGGARESNPTDYGFLQKSAIYVVDLQNAYRFNDHWQLAGCISYRGQNRYVVGEPGLRTERRYYARLYYRHNIKQVNLTWSFRPEYRTFYDHGEPWQLKPVETRLRLKLQASFSLNASRSNQLVIGEEYLLTPGSHSEDRFTTYFRHTFKKPRVVFDAGFMYQMNKDDGLIAHMAFDIILLDPFKVVKNL